MLCHPNPSLLPLTLQLFILPKASPPYLPPSESLSIPSTHLIVFHHCWSIHFLFTPFLIQRRLDQEGGEEEVKKRRGREGRRCPPSPLEYLRWIKKKGRRGSEEKKRKRRKKMPPITAGASLQQHHCWSITTYTHTPSTECLIVNAHHQRSQGAVQINTFCSMQLLSLFTCRCLPEGWPFPTFYHSHDDLHAGQSCDDNTSNSIGHIVFWGGLFAYHNKLSNVYMSFMLIHPWECSHKYIIQSPQFSVLELLYKWYKVRPSFSKIVLR